MVDVKRKLKDLSDSFIDKYAEYQIKKKHDSVLDNLKSKKLNSNITSSSDDSNVKIAGKLIFDNVRNVKVLQRDRNLNLDDIRNKIANNLLFSYEYLDHYDLICDLISNTIPLSFVTGKHLSLLNNSARVLDYNKDYLIPILEQLSPVSECEVNCLQIAKDIKFLFDPNAYTDYTKLKYYAGAEVSYHPEIRYIPRYNYYKLISRINEIESVGLVIKAKLKKIKTHAEGKVTPSELKIYEEFVTLRAIKLMVENLSVQLRFGDIAKQIKSILEFKQLRSEAEFRSQLIAFERLSKVKKRGIDLVCMQYIRGILIKYGKFPFHIKRGKLLFHDNITNVDVQLPIILMCLCNGAVHEFAGNLTHDDAIVFARHVLNCAKTSVSNANLQYKNDLRLWLKVAYSKINRIGVIGYDNDGKPNGVRIKELPKVDLPEFWKKDYFNKANKIVADYPVYFKEWVDKRMVTVSKYCEIARDNDDTAISLNLYFRDLTIRTHAITNFGIYHKTSLFLEYEKSIQPVVINQVKNPLPRKVININGKRYTLESDWASMHPYMALFKDYIFKNYKDKFANFLKNNNMESTFVTFLTNRSGGVKAEDLGLPKQLKNVSSARVIKFVLDREKYEIKEEFFENLSKDGKCTIRFQNDRRSRLVIIVNNEIQTNEIMFLTFFNAIKKDDGMIAIGKQIGNICDAKLQLIYSARLDLIKSNSDFKGMDTHTRPSLTRALRLIVLELMHSILSEMNTLNDKYFCFRSEEFEVNTIDVNGRIVKTEKEMISALVNHSMHVLEAYLPSKMTLQDMFFLVLMTVAEQTFASGFFATGANHTTFIRVMIAVLQQVFIQTFGMNLDLVCSVMGDDVIMVVRSKIEDALKWIDFFEESMKMFNYELDLDLSLVFATFLQQSAFCGGYVPLPSRMSILHDEKSDNLLNHPIENIRILSQILKSYFQRSFCFENVNSAIMSIWNNIRSHHERTDHLVSIDTNIFHPNLDFIGHSFNDTVTYLFPYVLPYVSPIGVSLPSISLKHMDGETYTNYRSLTTSIPGDFAYHAINSQFFTVHSPNLISDLINDVYYLSKLGDLIDWRYRDACGFTLSEYLLQFSRSESLREERINDISESVIEEMADVLRAYLPIDKISRSVFAINKLNKMGVSFPENLKYLNFPKMRIIQSLLTNLESDIETVTLDKKFLNYVFSYTVFPKENELKKHALTSFRFIFDQSPSAFVDVSYDYKINEIIPFLPSYNIGSDFSKVLAFMASPLRYPNAVSGSIGAIHGELGASFNIESAVNYGLSVYNRFKKLTYLYHVGAGLGLSTEVTSQYVNLVLEAAKYGLRTSYTSIYEHAIYFNICGWTQLLRDKYVLKIPPVIIPNKLAMVNMYYDIFMRDSVFAYAHLCLHESDGGMSKAHLDCNDNLREGNSVNGGIAHQLLLKKPILDISVHSNITMSKHFRSRYKKIFASEAVLTR